MEKIGKISTLYNKACKGIKIKYNFNKKSKMYQNTLFFKKLYIIF